MSEPFFCVWARNSELTSNLFNKRYYKTTCVEEKKDENMAPYVKTVREPLIKHSFFFGGGGRGKLSMIVCFLCPTRTTACQDGKVVACDPTYLVVACDPTYLFG